MAAFDVLRQLTRGTAGRLTLALGLATGLAAASAVMAPAAYADSVRFGVTIGDDSGFRRDRDRHWDEDFGYRPVFDEHRPRWRHRHARTRTVCRNVPVRVWDDYEGEYVFERVRRCHRVSAW
jgi:hypothetical protein